MEQRLKQRLVGAIVLVSLAVVFVPILFDSPRELNGGYSTTPIAEIPERPQVEADPPARVSIEAPETPRLDAEVEREQGRQGSGTDTAAAGAAASSATPASSSASSDASASAPASGATGSSASARSSDSSSAGSAPAAAEPDNASGEKQASASGEWVVQLGSFRESENARALRKSLLDKGYTAFVEPGSSAQGEVFRVFVGPMPRRQEAEDSAARLRREMALKGIVVPRSGG